MSQSEIPFTQSQVEFSQSQFDFSQSQSQIQSHRHVVPPVYCCYLLQSISKRQSFYIGSTPNPVRRLRQHNGLLNAGGAYRTKRDGTRPWEMVLVVYGFPNKISALQFEHAWQHGYRTRFIPTEDRIVKNKNSGRSLHHKLGLIRQLLNNDFFRYMNLRVNFFNDDILEFWESNKFKLQIESFDNSQVCLSQESQSFTKPQEMDVILEISDKNLQLVTKFYDDIILKVEELRSIYKEKLILGNRLCKICQNAYDYTSENETLKPYVIYCPNSQCHFESHLSCLYSIFLSQGNDNSKIIPIKGHCPDCNNEFKWIQYVRISTLIKSFDK